MAGIPDIFLHSGYWSIKFRIASKEAICAWFFVCNRRGQRGTTGSRKWNLHSSVVTAKGNFSSTVAVLWERRGGHTAEKGEVTACLFLVLIQMVLDRDAQVPKIRKAVL